MHENSEIKFLRQFLVLNYNNVKRYFFLTYNRCVFSYFYLFLISSFSVQIVRLIAIDSKLLQRILYKIQTKFNVHQN